jgi:hypothetical protein
MRWLVIVLALSACATPPPPGVGCATYGDHRGAFSDADFLASPDGMRAWVMRMDAAMTAACL